MKIAFSEAAPDYARYAFPYVVWGFPEGHETPADLFASGFLPSTPQLDRFYLCRQLRVSLRSWESTSENRRVLKKGAGLECRLVRRTDFDYSSARRSAWLEYAEKRFAAGAMPGERLDQLMSEPIVSHLLSFVDRSTGLEIGTVLLYLESPRLAYYYFAFYDLAWPGDSLGMFMMTRAVEFFSRQGYEYLYLGTCYDERALYKAQFEASEYFSGLGWSKDIHLLKTIVRQKPVAGHLLEDLQHPAAQVAHAAGIAHISPFRFEAPSPR